MKPYSESCEQNQEVIFEVIQPLLADKQKVLEIGSGTGQHAIYFAKRLPHLVWQTSDLNEYHSGIEMWLSDAQLPNTPSPIALNVSTDNWPSITTDVIFSANAVHIMSWQNVIDYITQATKILESKGLFILYGPFNYGGKYTSESNARFDQLLKQRDPKSGIRDFEAVDKLAISSKLNLISDIEMPANNRILCWQKN